VSRTLIVGFDGATLDLCERWIADGRMPTLAGLMRDGSYGQLRSTLPYNSAVAWTSLSTGANPGRHGVFDFVLPRRGDYGYRVATREDRRMRALWNTASEAGARVGIVNIPMTFPAEAVNGVMVSGMDAPQLDDRAVHPSGYLTELRRLSPGYHIISNAHHAASTGDFDRAERELIDVLVARSTFTCELAKPRDLDLVMVNFEATDGSHHFFWQHHDPSHPRYDQAQAARWGDTIGRVYEVTDRELGRLIDAYAPDTVFVASDHGGGPTTDWVLYMNDWLAHEGLLSMVQSRSSSVGRRLYGQAKKRLPEPVRQRLKGFKGLQKVLEPAKTAALYGDLDWSRSKAYAHVQPAVRLNLVGREAQGIVTDSQRDEVLADVAARATALRLPSGEPAFPAVHRADDVYPGDAPGGPDLVMEISPGLHIRSRNTSGRGGFVGRVTEAGTYFPSGVHVRNGIVVAAGTGIAAGGEVDESDILQVAPSVLAVMGIPVPTMEAGPLGFVTAQAVASGDGGIMEEAAPTDLNALEEEEVLERLRGLGYVD
jgi:predicted AlkP superfamily phosphohydrolase/phosphomutase